MPRRSRQGARPDHGEARVPAARGPVRRHGRPRDDDGSLCCAVVVTGIIVVLRKGKEKEKERKRKRKRKGKGKEKEKVLLCSRKGSIIIS